MIAPDKYTRARSGVTISMPEEVLQTQLAKERDLGKRLGRAALFQELAELASGYRADGEGGIDFGVGDSDQIFANAHAVFLALNPKQEKTPGEIAHEGLKRPIGEHGFEVGDILTRYGHALVVTSVNRQEMTGTFKYFPTLQLAREWTSKNPDEHCTDHQWNTKQYGVCQLCGWRCPHDKILRPIGSMRLGDSKDICTRCLTPKYTDGVKNVGF